MDESKTALSYTQRYTLNYYRKMVIALILQQCRVTKISSSVMNVLCNLLDQVLSCCYRTFSNTTCDAGFFSVQQLDHLLSRLSKFFMSTTPRDFVIQQYIDYLLNHRRISVSDNLPLLFGHRNTNSSAIVIIPSSSSEVIDS